MPKALREPFDPGLRADGMEGYRCGGRRCDRLSRNGRRLSGDKVLTDGTPKTHYRTAILRHVSNDVPNVQETAAHPGPRDIRSPQVFSFLL